jgi:hypothetical protein
MNQALSGEWVPVRGDIPADVSESAARALRMPSAVVRGRTRDVDMLERRKSGSTWWHFRLLPNRSGDAILNLRGTKQRVQAFKFRAGIASTLGDQGSAPPEPAYVPTPWNTVPGDPSSFWVAVTCESDFIRQWIDAGRQLPWAGYGSNGNVQRIQSDGCFEWLQPPVVWGAPAGQPGPWVEVPCDAYMLDLANQSPEFVNAPGATYSDVLPSGQPYYAQNFATGVKCYVDSSWVGKSESPQPATTGAPQRYKGEAHRPWPPADDGWHEVSPEDAALQERAASVLGSLPRWHYVDELRTTGLYRFFCYETPAGRNAVSALRFGGVASTLGDASTLGAIPMNLDNTASLMFEYLKNGHPGLSPSGRSYGQDVTIFDFQSAYNASGYTPPLVVDSWYGTETAKAAARAIQDADPGQSIAGMRAPPLPARTPAPAPAPVVVVKAAAPPPQVQQAGMGAGAVSMLVLGGMTLVGLTVAAATGHNPFKKPLRF